MLKSRERAVSPATMIVDILAVMAPIAKAHGCSPARLSLAWLLAKPVVTSIIIGAKRLDQLQDNLAAVELTLTQAN